MTNDSRWQALVRATTEMVAFETELAAKLEEEEQVLQPYPEALSTIEGFRQMVGAQRDRMAAYLESIGVKGRVPSGFTFPSGAGAAGALRRVSVAFSHGAVSYAMLVEMAFRLYEPSLRKIAPEHLKGYARATSAVNGLLPTVVARELSQEGLHCACVCPMCGAGACGCVAVGTAIVMTAWQEATVPAPALPGFSLQPPRPESELARAGIQGGERLLAMDGNEVHSIWDIQGAFRKHVIGEEVRLLVQRESDAAREVVVRHVSDYPPT